MCISACVRVGTVAGPYRPGKSGTVGLHTLEPAVAFELGRHEMAAHGIWLRAVRLPVAS